MQGMQEQKGQATLPKKETSKDSKTDKPSKAAVEALRNEMSRIKKD